MKEHLWKRVEAALDARVDPRDDPQLATELAADPEADAEVRRLLRRLAGLGEVAVAPRLRVTHRTKVAAAAAGFLLVAAGLVFWRQRGPLDAAELAAHDTVDTISVVVEHVTAPPPRIARVVIEPRRVLAWTLEGETP